MKGIAFGKILDTLLGQHRHAAAPDASKPEKKRGLTGTTKTGKKRGGPKGYVEELIDEGFFKTPKTLAAVRAELGNGGYQYTRHIPEPPDDDPVSRTSSPPPEGEGREKANLYLLELVMKCGSVKARLPTPVERLEQLVEAVLAVARTAKKHHINLAGLNFYGDKLAKLRTDATLCFKELGDPSVGDISAVAEMMQVVFAPDSNVKTRASVARELVHELRTRKWRATPRENVSENVFPLSLLAKTRRGYLITIGRQMNGCFESGWYDACAVMMRRLLETAIIEAFESKQLEEKIKTQQGDFFQLTALIAAALAETAWNLSRNTKEGLPRLRDIGHISAHSRRFTAQKSDIDKVQPYCRVVIEEFLHLAGLF